MDTNRPIHVSLRVALNPDDRVTVERIWRLISLGGSNIVLLPCTTNLYEDCDLLVNNTKSLRTIANYYRLIGVQMGLIDANRQYIALCSEDYVV